MKKIIVEELKGIVERPVTRYKAYIEEEPDIRETGDTKAEALGKLIMAFPSRLGIPLELR